MKPMPMPSIPSASFSASYDKTTKLISAGIFVLLLLLALVIPGVLRFFVIRPAAAPLYVEKADRLFALDRAARRFLAKKGVNVTPLCDLYRTDFAADEEPVELLDRLLK